MNFKAKLFYDYDVIDIIRYLLRITLIINRGTKVTYMCWEIF